MALRQDLRKAAKRFATRENALEQRVTALEAQIQELRAQNLRLAEITDVVQELLVPMAHRDEAKLREAIDAFTRSV